MMSFQKFITLVALMAFASHGAIAAPAGVESTADTLGKTLDTAVGDTTLGDLANAGIKTADSTLGNETGVGPREEDEEDVKRKGKKGKKGKKDKKEVIPREEDKDDEDEAKCKGEKGEKGKKDVIPREEDEEDAKCKGKGKSGKGKNKSGKGKKDT